MTTTNHISINEADKPIAQFIFAHGAGADKDSDFMCEVAQRLAEQNITVVRFNFPYMIKAAELGKRRPPDRTPVLQEAFIELVNGRPKELPLFVGGKSMGGRMSTLILQGIDALGAIVFGYPFHPPGKPEKLRTEHLESMDKPVLILQGQRDTFGTQEEVLGYDLSGKVETVFLTDGDHSLKPRKASGLTQQQHIASAVEHTVSFIRQQLDK